MAAYLLKLLSILIWSAFKYLVGFFIAIGSPPHFGLAETVISNVAGGMAGVIVYLYVWDYWVAFWKKKTGGKESLGIKINNRRRWIVRFIIHYEIYGIVFLTPLILTPPLGTILAAMVEKNKWKIKMYMFISFTCWSLGLYLLYEVFGIKLDEVITSFFT